MLSHEKGKFTKPLRNDYYDQECRYVIYRRDSDGKLFKVLTAFTDTYVPHWEGSTPIYSFRIRPKWTNARLAA
ncbi:hypothetical protein [Rhizobium phage RHph_X2_28B]|uniref:hypothetical protein n=1 Tax=Rhizobium phage RHph_X2_28B TaxID=2836086 RepID=UPI00232953D5|nr:hypothetical protein PP751_gp032 [Rhizobium phage RHph_X2_28B]QWY83484.1 hypothetical protein [Rhizobium phage RHph_X2_28B]QWY83720.1 hypothetical protein [Rhizobium phage RHph_X3_15]